jgi:hypothetical protein
MTAGANCQGSIWRWSFVKDDVSGGATPTGTFVYNDLLTQLQEEPTEMLLLQQGLQTMTVYKAVVRPPWYTIYERDEFQVNRPTASPYYGLRFRVINVLRSTHAPGDPRGYLILTLARTERAHGSQ